METCPFCKSEIPNGATVCAACGARKGNAFETMNTQIMGCFTIVMGLGWFIAGPLSLYFLYSGHGSVWTKYNISMQLFAWAVTVGGVWLFMKIMRRLSREVWLRQK
ncbi:MAG: hypothetical protein ACEB74_05390 [Desulfovibrio aminophilus]|uniref:hypothetical protein n=1 Tax=Desulfovibrio aminophilus TaxID=81425 RepID=UPI0039EA55CB